MPTPLTSPDVPRHGRLAGVALLVAACAMLTALALVGVVGGIAMITLDRTGPSGDWEGFGTFVGSWIAGLAGTVAVALTTLTWALVTGARRLKCTGDATRLHRVRSASAIAAMLGVVGGLAITPAAGGLVAGVLAALPVAVGLTVYGVLRQTLTPSPTVLTPPDETRSVATR